MNGRRFVIAIAIGVLTAATAHAQSGVQMSLDARVTLIQKDVGGERWAITHDPGAATVTGNVFFPGGGDAAFVWCGIVGQDGGTVNLDCFGSDPCPGAPCTPAEWDPLGPVSLPESFFAPPGGAPLSAVPCPLNLERVGSSCIDTDMRAAQNFDGATTTCHGLGQDLCSMEVLMACDTLDLSKGAGAPVSCGDATDEGAGRVLWTSSTFVEPGANVFANQSCYTGDNALTACAIGDIHEFFCCQPARQ